MPLAARNVSLQDYDGNILAGFWQYGLITWITFSTWLDSLIRADRSWAIFDLDKTRADRHGAQQQTGSGLVPAGDYILLQQDGSPLPVVLTEETARRRQPTRSNTPARQDHYCSRVRERDDKCLITGHRSATWSTLKAAHIFPRVHSEEWVRKGYPSLITDTAPAPSVGGSLKIDSIQNVILLRADIHELWDNYEFGVNPDDGYRITAFINGSQHVNGLVLQLNHITDPPICPLDELFRDHFLQGILKHVKGTGELTWDYEDAFGDGAFDLSRHEVWGDAEGETRLELELKNRLFNHQDLDQESSITI